MSQAIRHLTRLAAAAALSLGLLAAPVSAEVVGEVGVDWIGNDIIVEALADPEVKGVTCHVTYFERGVIDRLKNGNWFEDPSNNSIACRQTGPIEIGNIDLSKEGDEVFREGMSLIFKQLVVNRIYDRKNDTLIYLVHTRELSDGSAKMAISSIPLYGQNAAWKNGKPN
jgi:CreA protein